MNPITQPKQRISFSKIPFEAEYPDLLGLQIESFNKLFDLGDTRLKEKQKQLFEIFQEHFPITDIRGNFCLEFLGFIISPPCYTPNECIALGITYDVPIKIRLKLTCKDNEGTRVVEEEVYLTTIPYMTPKGSFIIKGIERVVISQLQRSYGVFFSQKRHATGVNLYTAKIIPAMGTWTEFSLDMYNVMYAYLDRRKKVPVTLLLRAIGYGNDKEILQLFDLAEEVQVDKKTLGSYKGAKIAGKVLKTWTEDYIDIESDELMTVTRHEIILERNTVLNDETIEKIIASDQRKIMVLKPNLQNHPFSFIYNTLEKDETNSEKEAIDYIYYQFRTSAPADEVTAREFIHQMLFGSKRAFVGHIGRYCLNKKLGLKIPKDNFLLTQEDIVATVKTFPALISGKRATEDLDSLVNRIVRLSGDLLYAALERGIKLTVHHAREVVNNRGDEELRPFDIVNGYYIGSTLNAFFGLDPNSQYKDQSNALSELEHCRRITKLGKNLNQETAGTDVRDVHPTHYGRLCPSSTPEGAKIGLISHFALYAKIDELGFLQAPYREVKDSKVNTKKVIYLTAEGEDKKLIAQHTSDIEKDGKIKPTILTARDAKGEFRRVTPSDVNYMDVRSDVAFSVAASLIPFISNTEPGRATGGANMQRQALPLITQQAPIVGTGQEKRVARDARLLITAEQDGQVVYVDADKIVISEHVPKKFEKLLFEKPLKTYHLTRLKPTNQGIAIIQKPIVSKGQKVKKGDFICEGYTFKNGELALGQNLRVAFMAWNGFNFEDSIVISRRVVQDDLLTSIHIEKFTVDLFNTKLGPEEFTADIPGVSEAALQSLDQNGIIRVGTEIKEGDILVGKITPQSNENPSSESKLMEAIFGSLAGSVRDTSFRAPFACKGTVIRAEILHGQQARRQKIKEIKKQIELLTANTLQELTKLRQQAVQKILTLLEGQKINTITTIDRKKLVAKGGKITKTLVENSFFPPLKDKKGIQKDFVPLFENYQFTKDTNINDQITFLFNSYEKTYTKITINYRREKKKIQTGNDLPPGVIKQAQIFVAQKSKIEVGDKLSGRHGNKGVISKIVPEEDMPYHEDGTRVDIVLNPLSLTSRMNLGQLYEVLLGWAGKELGHNYAVPIFERPSIERINKELAKANLPAFGLTTLYDGLTGEPFEQKVTCGVIYILKLHHLVGKKIHARATGPYALLTQQPLSGRTREGGQKVGEMEGWAYAAHGMAYTTRENYSIKSDDVQGRRRAQEAIYQGKNLPEPSVPESLKILAQILNALCLDIKFT